MTIRVLKSMLGRTMALFVMSALGIITGASVIAPELEIWKSACLAGLSAVFEVASKLARASLDGNLTMSELDEIFTPKAKREGSDAA